jgi:hypothetical protein
MEIELEEIIEDIALARAIEAGEHSNPLER